MNTRVAVVKNAATQDLQPIESGEVEGQKKRPTASIRPDDGIRPKVWLSERGLAERAKASA
jgi:hypothetical protein